MKLYRRSHDYIFSNPQVTLNAPVFTFDVENLIALYISLAIALLDLDRISGLSPLEANWKAPANELFLRQNSRLYIFVSLVFVNPCLSQPYKEGLPMSIQSIL